MSGLLNFDWLSENDGTNHRRKCRTEYVFNVLCICLRGYKRLSKGCDCKQEGVKEEFCGSVSEKHIEQER